METIYRDNNYIEGRRSGSDRRVSADPKYKRIEKRTTEDRRKVTRERKNKRFQAKEGAYASVPDHLIIGLIKDISKGGLALQYIAEGKQVRGDLSKIDIFSSGKNIHLKNVPFKTTSNFHVDSNIPLSTVILRQCGGQFGVLTDDQVYQLDRFIENYALKVKRTGKDRRQFDDPNYDGSNRRIGIGRRNKKE
jgi:hypothetical protein